MPEHRLTLIDRRTLVREALACSLETADPRLSVQGFGSIEDWAAQTPEAAPLSDHVVLIGDACRGSLEATLERLRKVDAGVPVVVLADREDSEAILEAYGADVQGFLPSTVSAAVAIGILAIVRAGGTYLPARSFLSARKADDEPVAPHDHLLSVLSEKQAAVVEALSRGKANKIIAYELNMCESTVKVHVRNIMRKLHARNRTEVAVLAARLGQIAPARSKNPSGRAG